MKRFMAVAEALSFVFLGGGGLGTEMKDEGAIFYTCSFLGSLGGIIAGVSYISGLNI